VALFDASKLADNRISSEQTDQVNDAVEKLRARLVDEIHTHVIPDWFVLSQTMIFFQGHIRRVLTLIEAAYDEYQRRRAIVSLMCVRGVYETVACVVDFCEDLHSLLDEGDFEKTAYFIDTRMLATRLKDLSKSEDDVDYTATNILKQIDRLSKRVADAREEYDYFSEVLHPNSLGAVLHFSEEYQLNEYESSVKFSDSAKTHKAAFWLVKAGFLLQLMDGVIGVTQARLSSYTFMRADS
jgi:hypothetical protein